MHILPLILAAAVLVPAALAQPTINTTSLLREIIDRDRLSLFPDPPYTCRQFSSYDRASTSPDNPDTWFANKDHGNFLRVQPSTRSPHGREWVLMDAPGPGAIVRFWSANPAGTLRVYLDGSDTPAIEAPLRDALGSRWKVVEPLSAVRARGYNLYFPIAYAKHCTVTIDGPRKTDDRGRESDEPDALYYQINYRTYPAGAAVRTFSMDDFTQHAAALNEVQTALMQPESDQEGPITEGTFELKPNVPVSLDMPPGPAAVKYIAMGLRSAGDSDEARTRLLRSVVIIIEFDGEQTVWCPLGDFFGSGVGHNVLREWYRSVLSSRFLHARWIMPYKSTAKFSLLNLSDTAATARLRVVTKKYPAWDDRRMHFHATWRQEHPLPTRPMSDWNFVEIIGKGVYVGDTLAVMNPVNEWWGEGDEKIYVDAEAFPSHFGTGTEDYYGFAWCTPETFTAPFFAQPRCDGQARRNNSGHSTVTRTRALDAIPFARSLKVDMEVWHWKECNVAYAATTYFYALPGATTNRPPQPESAAAAPPAPPR